MILVLVFSALILTSWFLSMVFEPEGSQENYRDTEDKN